jgi:four helix bundle protein
LLRKAEGVDAACAPGRWALFRVVAEQKEEMVMLRIYTVCLQMVRDVRPYRERIARFDRDLARQLAKASTSVPLNVAEGSGSRAGRRRNAYDIALAEAKETLSVLEVAEAAGYVRGIELAVRARLNHIIGTLTNLVR